jgi:hypothetical protein
MLSLDKNLELVHEHLHFPVPRLSVMQILLQEGDELSFLMDLSYLLSAHVCFPTPHFKGEMPGK